MSTKTRQFLSLCADVDSCQLCPRMKESARILSGASGPLDATIMFIGEAPGRLGADRTAIPFHGDTAGANFERLLNGAGIDRYNVYVTNAVLCNPRDDRGNNATPSTSEMHNCAAFLRRQIELVQPRVVATLGAKALEALRLIEPHELSLASGVGSSHKWFGRQLVPLYHPGARAMIHRPYHQQLSDYRALSHIGTPQNHSAIPSLHLARAILEYAGRPISYFALHKLFYLIEACAAEQSGSRLTNAYIIRQQNGPYVTDLHIKKLAKGLDVRIDQQSNDLFIGLSRAAAPSLFHDNYEEMDIPEVVVDTLRRFAHKSDRDLKIAAYLTPPMKRILRNEKSLGRVLNRPIII